ncbi:MAG: nucleoside triphosphate pyrophosphohydrolase [Candidatus Eisenbacteria bacterium]
MPGKPTEAFHRLVELTATLRSPGDGCAWDRAQTVSTIRPHLVEEFHEVLEALDAEDDEQLRDELGDLLFLIVFIARMTEEGNRFDLTAVIEGIDAKLRRRHPHVFGDMEAATPDAVRSHWETTKLEEKSHATRTSILDGLPRDFPALLTSRRLQEKAAAVGFDWDNLADVLAKVDEELAELRVEIADRREEKYEEELGDLLFAIVNIARSLAVDPEAALRKTNLKFRRRFALIEDRFRDKNLSEVGLEAMDRVWSEAKDREGKKKA